MIVVDASAALEVLLRGPAADALEARLFAPGETLHAPHLIDLEVAQVLRRHTLAGRMTAGRAGEALDIWQAFTLRRWPHAALLPRAWALRETLTAYDAAYIALAEALDSPLLTTDAKLARAAGHGARVEVAGVR
ncbi:type II toxin-antitoxin system VapC family toxin [Phenylobacterium sp.]|uniref:type II toxin-antitoxin system VapC family toxin n=1 Tax=Phenylobacterium sp. TaxID=1871053 RepID=UPI00374D5A77